jgi:hypothetical protein
LFWRDCYWSKTIKNTILAANVLYRSDTKLLVKKIRGKWY